jgi:hypothetical protein
MSQIYKVPEQPTSFNVLVGYTVSIGLAFLVSVLYGLLSVSFPIPYFHPVFTFGFALVLGFGVRTITKAFKIVSRRITLIITLVTSVLGWYFQWAVYILFSIIGGDFLDVYISDSSLVFYPWEVARIMSLLFTEGAWFIGDILFKGWPLLLFWLGELLMLLAIPVYLVYKQPVSPFSNMTNKWYRKYVLHKDFESIALKEKFEDAIAGNLPDTIDRLKNGGITYFCRISIYYLKDEERQYLRVENISRDKTGKNERPLTVIDLQPISKEDAVYLMEKYHAKKAFYFDY